MSLDWKVRSLMDSATPYSGAPDAWRDYGLTGDGVGVAVLLAVCWPKASVRTAAHHDSHRFQGSAKRRAPRRAGAGYAVTSVSNRSATRRATTSTGAVACSIAFCA